MFSLTLFKPPRWWEEKSRFVFDNKTHRRMDFEQFSEFEDLLYKLAKIPKAGKQDAELISPAVFLPDTTRKNINVVEWAGWAAVDVDSVEFEGDLEQALVKLYGDWQYVCYSTASSTLEKPKFRLIFPLKVAVDNKEIKQFWYALNQELGEINDAQTKDLSRMYYIPATYSGANNFIFSNNGSYIDPLALIGRHPLPVKQGLTIFDRLPEEMQKLIIQHQKDKAENTGVSWRGYNDCPFLSKGMIRAYQQKTMVPDSGRFMKMYEVMVHIACNAVESKYPISINEVVMLCKEMDVMMGNRYEDRAFDLEASNAIEYAYKSKC
jgi:hypothetical protein